MSRIHNMGLMNQTNNYYDSYKDEPFDLSVDLRLCRSNAKTGFKNVPKRKNIGTM